MTKNTKNPFNISFGEEPLSFIDRPNEFNDIVDTFKSESPETKIKLIVGPRGSGKTVLLNKITEYFHDDSNWLVVDLTQYSNMLDQLAGKLYETGKIKNLFIKKEFDFSFHGVSFSITGENPISNVESLLERIFTYLSNKSKRILITIDDIAPNDYVKQFIQSYQGFIRSKYPVYLLMTGLYENVSDLQNTNNLTFLLRAPKVVLSKLSLRAMTLKYINSLSIDYETALKLAKVTKGYAYAYQLIGNILFKSNSKDLDEENIQYLDLELENNVYLKIWESMSQTDKDVAFMMLDHTNVSDIIEALKINNSKFQVYRRRLINIGVADDTIRGQLSFSLPRFKEFVQFQKDLLD